MNGKLRNTLISDEPKTELGKKLREIRLKIIYSGETLFDWDDLRMEIEERRYGDRYKDQCVTKKVGNEKADLC